MVQTDFFSNFSKVFLAFSEKLSYLCAKIKTLHHAGQSEKEVTRGASSTDPCQDSIDEAKQHASKNYLSTIAIVHHFDEILANAVSVGKTATKVDDRNQSQFDYMLILSYQCQGIGLVRLTVGIRKKLLTDHSAQEIKTEYGISAVADGQKIEIPRD